MKRQIKTHSVVQKIGAVERYLFLSSKLVYEVKSTPSGLFMKKEKPDNIIFAGEIVTPEWFATKQEYLDRLMGFGLVKKI